MAKGGVPGWQPTALQEARRRRGLTQAALAERVGLSRTAIANYERSGGFAPPPAVLLGLARTLDCRPEELIQPGRRTLKVLRALAGLSQAEVVAQTRNMKVSQFRSVEQGRVRRLHAADAADLARALGVTITEVVDAHRQSILEFSEKKQDLSGT
ncbi:helix-turn-helix transcriptional regulator [Streptomonospora nanhaiensis]